MFGQTWEHDIIRKYVIIFGTLFNDIFVNRHNADNENEQTIKVPLNYGPKDKILARLKSDPDLDREMAIVLPRMTFEIVSMTYAAERKTNSMNKHCSANTDLDIKNYQYAPVPFDFTFALYVMTRNVTDGTRIIEQILPYFRPQFNVTTDLIDGLGEDVDVPIIFNDITTEDSYEGDFTSRRTIVHTLTFTVKGFLFGPTRTSRVIKSAETAFKIMPGSNTISTVNTAIANSVNVTVTPGLDANGNPTSNSSLSVGSDQIASTDNYGWIIDITEDL